MDAPLIEWAVASFTLTGQVKSGDLYLVKPLPHGVLVAVMDGIGHGDQAAAAATMAVATLGAHAEHSVITLIKRCHQALIGTRGVVMSLTTFSALDNTMVWLGVGNVEGALLRVDTGKTHSSTEASATHEFLLLRGGVVGYQLPPLLATVIPLSRGDMLIFATDGIYSGFTKGINLNDPPQQIADRIMAQHGKGTDDALVLVARWLGYHDGGHSN